MSESKYYIVKTVIGAEKRVIEDMKARLADFGSLKEIREDIGGLYHEEHMRGYIIVEAIEEFHVEKLIGKGYKMMNTTPIKGVKGVLGILDDISYITPKSNLEGLEIGNIVEITKGAFKGERAVINMILESKEEVKLDLYDTDIPLSLTIEGKHVRNA